MDNDIILDKDSFGILADFLDDDLQFLLFLKTFDIRPKDKEIDWDTLDWENISRQELTVDFIREFKEYLNWDIITNFFLSSEVFIREFQDKVVWDTISSKMKFRNDYDYDFFEEFSDRFNWIKISKWGNMDEHFVIKFEEYLDWNIISGVQGLTEYLIRRFNHKINWENFNRNYHVPQVLRDQLIDEYNPQEEEKDNGDDVEMDFPAPIIFGPPPDYDVLNSEELDEEDTDEDIDLPPLEPIDEEDYSDMEMVD